jgi:nucleoside-diphosphate-sugar epimerase
MKLDPTSPYGVSKLAAEDYVKLYFKLYGFETVSLRYFNVYGPRQRFDAQSAYGGVITTFVERISRNLPPTIFGDGEQTRDFVYVRDVIEANMLALNSKNACGDVFNIGTGMKVSVNQVANILKELLNRKDLRNMYADSRPADIQHSYADTNKAKQILGYSPEFSIREGLSELVSWYKNKRPLVNKFKKFLA